MLWTQQHTAYWSIVFNVFKGFPNHVQYTSERHQKVKSNGVMIERTKHYDLPHYGLINGYINSTVVGRVNDMALFATFSTGMSTYFIKY